MTSFGKFTLRFAAYGIILIYLACDLFLFHGPLYNRLQADKPDSAESIADAKRRGVAAVVYGREITLRQIDHAVHTRLVREGDSHLDSLTSDQLRLHRYAALSNLIDHELLRVKVMHSSTEFPVETIEIDAAMSRMIARYPDESAFCKALAASGESEDTLRARFAARIQQTKYAESRIEPGVADTDPISRHRAAQDFREQLRKFETNRDRIHIRHAVLQLPMESSSGES